MNNNVFDLPFNGEIYSIKCEQDKANKSIPDALTFKVEFDDPFLLKYCRSPFKFLAKKDEQTEHYIFSDILDYGSHPTKICEYVARWAVWSYGISGQCPEPPNLSSLQILG